ncbi:hypothetical protein Dform_00791 [Dehalogenimonas formicexedens]|uniref:Uncharacterized protein n=1 Tax=Dehalogenimonas formicexedens TaxID=1839801 RepID=A0A1P8F6N7_9CHLR|nr:hypothetical protein [Dehalogenimonas formicexedens]APV44139.1 hypothetical protein Dform_00791 [Dehalogenimonas formicexedens]
MAEELGKIQRPEVSTFKGKRKLYVVPLLYRWPEAPKEYVSLFDKYWKDVESQLKHLEQRIGAVKQIYHEGIDDTGEESFKALEEYNPSSYNLSRAFIERGAVLNSIEERELISETMDWERCIMMGFSSAKVAKLVTEQYREAMKNRYDHIVRQIDETLDPDEAGVLFIREGHPIQFPRDIEIFSVFPPSLDEVHRFMRNRPVEENEAADTRADSGDAEAQTETGQPAGEG